MGGPARNQFDARRLGRRLGDEEQERGQERNHASSFTG
jgi:hypothetical protein